MVGLAERGSYLEACWGASTGYVTQGLGDGWEVASVLEQGSVLPRSMGALA
jgi:hypothetical protein